MRECSDRRDIKKRHRVSKLSMGVGWGDAAMEQAYYEDAWGPGWGMRKEVQRWNRSSIPRIFLIFVGGGGGGGGVMW